jgi:DNA invertase Pin-like site-specific DNA recombinase
MSRTTTSAGPAVGFSYLRFSSAIQAEGDSRRRQTELCDRWCERNGVALDPLRLRDEGVSGFTGSHRENPDRHALAAFLELIRQKRVAKGSYLIIENLDRLTREDTVPALHLFTGILTAGVRIVQLEPESVYTDKSEFPEVMRAIMELSRGNSESRMKSFRLTKKWEEKKRRAAAERAPLRGPCPAWVRLVLAPAGAVRYELIPKRAEVVRRIFRMAADGEGVRAITAALARERVQPIGGRGEWNRSYVRKILTTPAAYGTYQPMKGSTRRRQGRAPDGPPIADFYPAVVTEQEYLAAQGARIGRRRAGGRPSKFRTHLFTGLLYAAGSDRRLYQQSFNYAHRTYPAIVYPAGDSGRDHTFPLDVFEDAVLSRLKEIDPKEILPADRSGDRVLALAARYAEIEGRLAKVKAKLRVADEVDTLIELVRELEAEKAQVGDDLAAERRRAASPLAEAWGECGTLVDVLRGAPDERAARLKLRSILRRIVEGVWCLFLRPGGRIGPKVAAVQVRFAGGRHRDYLIVYVPAHGNAAAKRPAGWRVRSFAESGVRGALDLRKPEHAARLTRFLEGVEMPAG